MVGPMPLAEHLRTTVVSFAELLDGHVRLLKIELAEDAKVVGVQVGKIAAFAPLLLVGYGFVNVALALWLRRFVAADLSFLLVGLLNLLVAGAGIAGALLALKRHAMMPATHAELAATSATMLKAVGREAPHG